MGEIVLGCDGADDSHSVVWVKRVDEEGADPDDAGTRLDPEWKDLGYITEDGFSWRGSTPDRPAFRRALDQALAGGATETAAQLTASEVTDRWRHFVDQLAGHDPDAAAAITEAMQQWQDYAHAVWEGPTDRRQVTLRETLQIAGYTRPQGYDKSGDSAAVRAHRYAQAARAVAETAWWNYITVHDLHADLAAEEEARIRRWHLLNGDGD